MAYLTSSLDASLDFSKHTRVAIKGSAHDFAAFDAVAPADRRECTLPESGRTYRALKTTSEESRIDIAFNFVGECDYWVDRYVAAKAALEPQEEILDGMAENDPGYAAQERLVRELRSDFYNADGELRTTEQLLIYMQRLNELYEFGLGY
jgi:hypothetical protein